MSGTTFTTYPVQSHQTAQTAPSSGAGTDHAASLEKSYQSASTYSTAAPQPSAYAEHGPGPGLTTLAVGEEDGGAMMTPPANGPMSTPQPDNGLQVTTLAIGEEDGGGYGTMQPIRDDHSTIGGISVGDNLPPSSGAEASDEYGRMQPIYSPGEAEYPAFAKTSETPNLLNFHPVARVPKTAIAPPAPAATTAPVTVAAPVAAQPISMGTMPVGMQAEAVPQSGAYQTVGSYEEYVNGASTQSATPAPAPEATYQSAPVETGAVYEPLADTGTAVPSSAPVEAAPSQPVYETYQPVAEASAYESGSAADAPAAVDTQPVYAEPAAPAPAPEYVAPAATVEASAPVTSVEPQQKPDLFTKDAPYDSAGAVEPADPADGNPDYVAPVETAKDSTTAKETASSQAAEPKAASSEPAAPQTEASYVSVSIDDYLVDPAAPKTASAAPETAPAEPTSASNDAPVSAPADSAPAAPIQMAEPKLAAKPAESMSLGGSYRVIDSPVSGSMTGMSSGVGNAGPAAAPAPAASSDAPNNGLQIMTLAVGEESGAL